MSRALPIAQNGSTKVSESDWNNWRWQLRHMLRSADDFDGLIDISDAERSAFERTSDLFIAGVTPYYASLMHKERSDCPIRMQALPSLRELEIREEEMVDPLGEDIHSPVSSIFHKYPDRCLLYVVNRCAIYCRHCNRRRKVGDDNPPGKDDLKEAVDYIASQPRIRDVLISGGDPLLLSDKRLDDLLSKLRAIPHVEIIRIGTRVPVVLPMRIDDALCEVLAKYQPVFVNTHFNHPVELTDQAAKACAKLVDHGVLVGNQAVLLRGINSSVQCLRALMRKLIRNRIRPYYLFQGDTVIGTDHLRTRVEVAIELYDGLRGWMSGMALPHLVLDAPGGGGKIPIGPAYLQDLNDERALLRNYRGELVEYPQPLASTHEVSFDELFFAGELPDDDRVGGA